MQEVSISTITDQCGCGCQGLGNKPEDSRAMSSEEMTSEHKRPCQSTTAAAGYAQVLAVEKRILRGITEPPPQFLSSSLHLLGGKKSSRVGSFVVGGRVRGLKLSAGDLLSTGGRRMLWNASEEGCCARY